MEDILDSIRRIISNWLITTVQLTASASAGSSTLIVRTTKRFKKGDELIVKHGDEDVENLCYVDEVVDGTTLRLVDPLRFNHSLSDDPYIVKTTYGQYLKDVFIGEPSVITDFPAVTVNGMSRSSEWYTIRATKERFNIEIGVFVQEANFDDATRYLYRITDILQRGLKKNIYPLVNDYNTTTLQTDIAVNDVYINVADSSIFTCGAPILIEDDEISEPNQVNEIVDANTVKLNTASAHAFDKTETTIISPRRYIYNSWPSDISYGKINKGSMLKAAAISYFCEETEIQGEGGWQDTSLS